MMAAYEEFSNGTYIWEHIILFLVSGSLCRGMYVARPVLPTGFNTFFDPLRHAEGDLNPTSHRTDPESSQCVSKSTVKLA